MSCSKCMSHKPYGPKQFVCPECNQTWVLAGVGPGNYWEPLETQQKEHKAANKLTDEFKQKYNKSFHRDGKKLIPISYPVVGDMPETINCPTCGTLCRR